VGVVLHEMLTLSPLFGGDHDLAILHKVLEMPIVRPSDTRPDVPPALDAIVMKALERDPALRYASAAEMARDLDEFVVGAQFHVDDVVRFLRSVEPLLNPPRPSVAALRAASIGTMTTEPAAEANKLDLVHRLRMSPLGRLFFGRKKH
jgi:serine/threonine protein kinase